MLRVFFSIEAYDFGEILALYVADRETVMKYFLQIAVLPL